MMSQRRVRSIIGILDNLERILLALARLAPWLILAIMIGVFHSEVAQIVKNISAVEMFGIKIERTEFDRAISSAKKENEASPPSHGQKFYNIDQRSDAAFRLLSKASPMLKNMSLLWVDDHPENNFALRRILLQTGVRITIAINNAEALDQVLRHDFDLIISDFSRDPPLQENGGHFIRQVEQTRYAAPVVIYTSSLAIVPTDLRTEVVTSNPATLIDAVAKIALSR